jgi:AcrR family transcriptional regulator
VPTGVALRDAREQLFDAAERVLRRDGPRGLTSRAVTTEAGVAKGVMHRHFVDFDSFLVALITDRIAGVEAQAVALRGSAGAGSVVDNITGALMELFQSVALSIVGLLIFRDDLRARLRPDISTGVPILTDATAMLASYLEAEREAGRVDSSAEVTTLAPTLIGAGHLLFADREVAPDRATLHTMVTTVMASALRHPRP